jgi:hypothetical protein
MLTKELELKRYHTADELKNPFFVVVHAEGEVPTNLNPQLYDRVMNEIEAIREKHDWVPMNDWPPSTIPEGVPKDRPILVCGFYDHVCVQEQRDSLRRAGYEAYISRQGTF